MRSTVIKIEVFDDFNWKWQLNFLYSPVSQHQEDLLTIYCKHRLPFVDLDHILKQRRWIKNRPWLMLNGKTVMEGIQILNDLDW